MILGSEPDTQELFVVPERDRESGVYMLGVQGAGKSGLIETMVHADIRRSNAVVVIDPHGDLVSSLLASIPPEYLDRVFVLALEDEQRPFGINMFAVGSIDTDVKRTQVIDRILNVFEVLWPEVMDQQNLPRFLWAAIIVFLDNPGATLVDMYDFFLDEAVRARMMANVKDPTVRQFWANQYDNQSDAERNRRVQPLINRLEHLFMGRSLVRNIVGQRKNSISFRQVAEERRIILVKLSQTLKQDSRLIGTLLIAQISAAIFSFADLPRSQRPGLSVYVDEAQNFSTHDFARLFSEGRKFGARVTLAHQYRNQLQGFLKDATDTARTKVCFQLTPDDGREMGRFFPAPEATVDPESIATNAADQLTIKGTDHGKAVAIFSKVYLQPLHGFMKGGHVQIRNKGTDWFGTGIELMGAFGGANASTVIEVDDPIPYLNSLLYDVMRRQNPHLPIPPEVIRGLANTGRSMWAVARGVWHHPGLQPHPDYPPSLVTNGHWLRAPEDSKEQFWHCIYYLRATMAYLAQHPMGKATAPNASAVGQMLSRLPRRSAFVRSGDDVGVIYTLNTPSQVSGQPLTERLARIRHQTHVTYCHPREEVEAAGPFSEVVPGPGEATIWSSRWEDIDADAAP